MLLVFALGTPGVVSQNSTSKVTFFPFLHMYERSVGSTIFVGFRGGKSFNHRQVVFLCGSPYSYGCMICVGFFHTDDIIPTGFSIAIRGQFALTIAIKKAMLLCCRPSFCFCSKCRAPETARSVQGGCAISRSHAPACVCVCICGRKRAVAVYQIERVALYVPFRTPAAALLQIARKRPVAFCAKRLAYRLAFLASDKNVHSLSLHSHASTGSTQLSQPKTAPYASL